LCRLGKNRKPSGIAPDEQKTRRVHGALVSCS
jgi:hypothetical protein